MGDPSDFDAWYQEQHPRVLGALTVASGSADIAAEATDEAFVRAYERWDRVRRMASPGGWLYRVALNYLRRRFRRQTLEQQLLRRQAPETVAPASLDPHVWDAVRSLPRRQRTAVALRYVLDLPEAEVARLMGVSRGAASASLTTARRRLEDLLADPPAETSPRPSGPPQPWAAQSAAVGRAGPASGTSSHGPSPSGPRSSVVRRG
jgi:RNA polymerase sigma factor (sigma-70 family)